MAGQRKQKVEAALRQELAQIIRDEVNDPRVAVSGILTIGQVEMTRDLSMARVPVSFGETPEAEAAAAFKALERAAGFLRGAVARTMNLRHAPELRFYHDQSAALASKLDELLHESAVKAAAVDAPAATDADDDGADPQ